RAENLERARETERVHRRLRTQRSCHQHCAIGVVPLAMAGRTIDDRLMLGDAGYLRIVGIGIVFRMNRDQWPARAVAGTNARRETGYPTLDPEAPLFKQSGHEFRRLDLLHPQFAEIKYAVVERRDRCGIAISLHDAIPPTMGHTH